MNRCQWFYFCRKGCVISHVYIWRKLSTFKGVILGADSGCRVIPLELDFDVVFFINCDYFLCFSLRIMTPQSLVHTFWNGILKYKLVPLEFIQRRAVGVVDGSQAVWCPLLARDMLFIYIIYSTKLCYLHIYIICSTKLITTHNMWV